MLGKLLREKRIKDGYTIDEMTDKVGFKRTYLTDIELGKRIPKNGCTLKKLSDGYKIDFDIVLDSIVSEIKSEVE